MLKEESGRCGLSVNLAAALRQQKRQQINDRHEQPQILVPSETDLLRVKRI